MKQMSSDLGNISGAQGRVGPRRVSYARFVRSFMIYICYVSKGMVET
jgi:hypothetical protein